LCVVSVVFIFLTEVDDQAERYRQNLETGTVTELKDPGPKEKKKEENDNEEQNIEENNNEEQKVPEDEQEEVWEIEDVYNMRREHGETEFLVHVKHYPRFVCVDKR
jgi:nitroimidazol reductase NimA-like FMN-containing flavoprotein (pyridoxamine 5'-phosphate oxidase superfamily)